MKLLQPDNAYMYVESVPKFNSAYADANSPAVAFTLTTEIRQVTASETARTSLFPSISDEVPRIHQKGGNSDDGEHIRASASYEGAK